MGEPASRLIAVESPCIGTCTLGPDGLCVGCFRTADEIAGWLGFNADERRRIMSGLPARAQALFDE